MKTFIILTTVLLTLFIAAKTNNAAMPHGDCYHTPAEIVEMANRLGGK